MSNTKPRAPQKLQIVIAAGGKKKKSPRSQLLSAIMSETSGDTGEAMAEAFSKGHTEKLRGLLEDMVESIVKKASK